MWKWIQAIVLSIIIICIGHFSWQFFRDNFTKPVVKPFVLKDDIEKQEREIIQNTEEQCQEVAVEQVPAQQVPAQYVPAQQAPIQTETTNEDNKTYDELDNYLKSKINVLNTTDISSLTTQYDTPSS